AWASSCVADWRAGRSRKIRDWATPTPRPSCPRAIPALRDRDTAGNRTARDPSLPRASACLQPVDHRLHRLDIGIFELEIGQIGEVIAFMLVGAGLDRDDRAIAAAEAVHR